MMGYGGNYGMMGAGGAGSLLGVLTWLVTFVDLVLVGLWLWKQLQKK